MSFKNLLKWFFPYLAVWAGLFLFHSAWLALIGLHIAFLLILVLSPVDVSPMILLKGKSIRWIFFNIVLCGVSGFAVYYLYPLFGDAQDLTAQLKQLGLDRSTLPSFIAYFSLVNPFFEEYFWRVFHGSENKVFHIGDLIYAGYHAIVLIKYVPVWMTLLALACLTFIGWFWRQIKREDGGSLAPVLGHMAADFSILTAVYFLIR